MVGKSCIGRPSAQLQEQQGVLQQPVATASVCNQLPPKLKQSCLPAALPDAPDSDMHSHGDGPAVAHGAGILDAAAAGAAAQQQPGAAAVAGQPEDLQLQEGHPQAASSDTTEVEGGLSSFPAAGLHAPTTSGAGGTAAGAAAEAMVSTPVTAPTGAEAEVVAEGTSTTGATSAHTAATTHADASDLQPSCSRSPEPCEGAPAVLPVVPGSHVSSSSSSRPGLS